MTPIYRMMLLCAVFMAAFIITPLYAQSLDATTTTSGGLTVSHPEAWSAVENSPLTLVLTNSDDWLINISAGDEAIYSSEHKGAYASAVDAMQYFTDFLIMAETQLPDTPPMPFEMGIIAALRQTAVSSTNVPYEIITFNLPDGTVVLALMGHQTLAEAPTPDMQSLFQAVLSSVDVTAPAEPAATEEDLSAADQIYIPEGAVIIADLEPGMLRFENGVEATYPEGWAIHSDNPYIQSTATLFYGQNLITAEAYMVINVQDSADMTIDTFRESIMSMSAMLYTGREDYDPERDIVTETLPDGRVMEYLDTSTAEVAMGNTYIVPLDARYWAWVMFSNLSRDDAAAALRTDEVLSIMKSLTLTAEEGAIMYEGYRLIVQSASCDRAVMTSDINQSAPYGIFECPADCLDYNYSVWGTDTYTLDSTLCAAAIHAGVIDAAEGGTVLATWLPGQTSYAESERNGVTTSEYGAWDDSFEIAPFVVESSD